MTSYFSPDPASAQTPRGADGEVTSLDVGPLVGAAQVARFVGFLHREAGAPQVDLMPQTERRFHFQLAVPSTRLIEAFLESKEFLPKLIRSFASGILQVQFADDEGREPQAGGSEAAVMAARAAQPPRASPETETAQPTAEAGLATAAAPDQAEPAAGGAQLLDALARLAHVLDETSVVPAPLEVEPESSAESNAAPAPETVIPAASAEADAGETIALRTEAEEAAAGSEQGGAASSATEPVFLRDMTADAALSQSSAEPSEPATERETVSGQLSGVQLIARPFSNFGQLNRFITAIGGLPGVQSVALRRFRDGTLWLAVDCSNAAEFATRLRAQREIAIEIISEGDGTIEVSVHEESRQAASI